ncbi:MULTISPECIES: hypothetical protein [unclassified Streptomyces]|uniref:hypothetical protein n=1 Tax=unclassified Streptomyces TaxID=2593676 RepID=UPI0022715532|nr:MULTISPECIES: hypothetical protein [unclassified Streptomyces]MCY0922675.1 hypothetical protein [Streptomyces sp. H27-G5]MCY0963043.1 hypothetical protein [Streptomyces sp. H27-H5]
MPGDKQDRATTATAEWQQAATALSAPTAGRRELDAHQRCERARVRRPADPLYAVPTRLGNLVHASERRIADRYGRARPSCGPPCRGCCPNSCCSQPNWLGRPWTGRRRA